MFIVFDTETNGKPKDWKAKMSAVNNWPRVAELAWNVYDTNELLIKERSFLIYPDGWEIPNEKFFIENGMSTERNMKAGVFIKIVLGYFIDDMQECEYLVAHNLAFDYNTLGAEMIRAGMRSGKKLKQICTMESTTNFCRLPGKYGDFKWPKLEELHEILFGVKFDNAHEAGGDVKATGKCLFELISRGVIKI